MREDMGQRMNLEEFLLTENERMLLDSPTYKGFSFLVDVLLESDAWERGPVPGQISFDYAPHTKQIGSYLSSENERFDKEEIVYDVSLPTSVKVILDLRSTLGNNFICTANRHLEVIVHSKSTGRSTNACIVNPASEDMPITDDCTSFILWALSGFLSPPRSLISAIIEVCDSDAYDRLREITLDHLQNMRALRLSAELLRQNEIERRRNFEDTLSSRISRLIRMTWAELAHEHRGFGTPNNRLDEEVYNYMDNILYPSQEEFDY